MITSIQKTVIGLAGRAGSGKSTCAKWLEVNLNAERFSLAAPLKDLARDVFGFSEDQVRGSQAAKEAIDPRYGFSPREALIRLGHYARTHLGADIWLRACERRILASPARICVVEDVRYPNEAEWIANFGAPLGRLMRGVVIRLHCPNADTTVDPNAPSEKSVDEINPMDIDAEIGCLRSPDGTVLVERLRDTLQHLGVFDE